MTRTRLTLTAVGGSMAVLLAALGFQYFGDLEPCVLCIWQRWPHLAAIALGAAAVALGGRLWPRLWLVLGAVAVATSAGIGAYHVGVEQGWWAGTAFCSAGSLAGISAEDLLNPAIIVAAPVSCDAVAWAFAGLSMAAWNVLLSGALAGLWLLAARRS